MAEDQKVTNDGRLAIGAKELVDGLMLRQHLELVSCSAVTYPRPWRVSPDILIDLILFLRLHTLFRLNSTSRVIFEVSKRHPALAELYSKGLRHSLHICVNKFGFKVSEQQVTFNFNQPRFDGTHPWTIVPEPIFPLPTDQIEGFHDVCIRFPFRPEQRSEPKFLQPQDLMLFLKNIATFLSKHGLYLNFWHAFNDEEYKKLVVELLSDVLERFSVVSFSFHHLNRFTAPVMQMPAIRRTTHAKILLSPYIDYEHYLEFINCLLCWLKNKDEHGTKSDAYNIKNRPENNLGERILFFCEEPSSVTFTFQDIILRAVIDFNSSTDMAPFVIAFKSENRRPRTTHTTPMNPREYVPEDFKMVNENTGEMLTFAQTVDEFEAAATTEAGNDDANVVQQQQQANINANGAGPGNGQLAVQQQQPAPLLMFLRRRPVIGPLLPVDMTYFERLPISPNQNGGIGHGNQPLQPQQNRIPMVMIDQNGVMDF